MGLESFCKSTQGVNFINILKISSSTRNIIDYILKIFEQQIEYSKDPF